MANTIRALGDLYLRTARFPEAENAYHEALAAFTAIDDLLGQAYTRKALGYIYTRAGRFADAEDAFRKALAAFIDIDDRPGEAETSRALGDLYVSTNRLTKAEDAYRKALAIFVAIDDRLGEASSISSMGLLALYRGQLADSFERFRAARTMLLAIEARQGAAGQLGYMARAAVSALAFDRAIVLADMARRDLHMLDDPHGVMVAEHEISRAALAAHHQELATYARYLTWHHAKESGHRLATALFDQVAKTLPPEKIAAGLDPEDVNELERQLAAAIAEVAKRLEEAGEDPFGPLAPPPSSPSLPSEET
jgi:tetratricopeptide (TPR) repeat protein